MKWIPESRVRELAAAHMKDWRDEYDAFAIALMDELIAAATPAGVTAPAEHSAPLAFPVDPADEWRVGEFWSSSNPSNMVLVLSVAEDIERNENHPSFIRWVGGSVKAAQDDARDAEIAGLESCVNHLSAIVDDQLRLLKDVEDICGRDGCGGVLEDGESEIIDRVRKHLSGMAEPVALSTVPASEPVSAVELDPEVPITRSLLAAACGQLRQYALPAGADDQVVLNIEAAIGADGARLVGNPSPDSWVKQHFDVARDAPKTDFTPQHNIPERTSMNLTDHPQLPAIGEALHGGFFAGLINLNGRTHALVVSPKDSGDCSEFEWLASERRVEGADSYCDGFANTEAMAAAGSEMAQWARKLSIGGYDDWFIPSQDELEIIYRNLKPTTETNSLYGRSGINASALPPTAAYTANAPTQTGVAAFAEGGEEAFEDAAYWPSTQHAAYSGCAWGQHFSNGNQDGYIKSASLRARAVRRFAI